MAESTIEQRLAGLGATLTFPRADELVDDVLAAIEPAAARAGTSRRRVILFAAAAVLLVVAVVVAAVPDSRRAVARWLGFENLRIEHVERLPEDVPPARLGPAMSLDSAATIAGVVPRVAGDLGAPLSVHAPGDRYVAVRYAVDGNDVIVATLPGRVDEGMFSKLATGETEVAQLDVAGAPGYWITGAEHAFLYIDADGAVQESRLAADTLVWQHGDVILRVEGDIPLEQALAIAATVREP